MTKPVNCLTIDPKTNLLYVGTNCCIEVFSFEHTLKHLGKCTINFVGDILQIFFCGNEVLLCCFSGMHFGQIKKIETFQWHSNKVYFKNRLISTVVQLDITKFMACDMAQGIYLIDRSDSQQVVIPIQGESSGCTDLLKTPLYHEDTFPYLIARTKFKI